MISKLILVIVISLGALAAPVFSQAVGNTDQGFVPNAYKDTDAIGISLHQVYRDESGQFKVGPALDLANPALSFNEGDRFVIRYRSNFAAYIYFISVSAAGTQIAYPTNSGDILPLDIGSGTRDYAFRLQGRPGREHIVILVSKARIPLFDEKIQTKNFLLSNETSIPFTSGNSAPQKKKSGFKGWLKAAVGLVARVALPTFLPPIAGTVASNLLFRLPFFDVQENNQVNARLTPEGGKRAKLGNTEVMTFQISYQYQSRQ
jgi:hypothetical protein